MPPDSSTPLVIIFGFAVGAALYAMLLAMVLRNPVTKSGGVGTGTSVSVDLLLLATGLLGLLWNVGGLFDWLSLDLLGMPREPIVSAIAYSALGFLPSVVVHSVFNRRSRGNEEPLNWRSKILTITAYVLSGVACIWHLSSAIFLDFAPSYQALRVLTFGYLFILVALLVSSLRQSLGGKALWATALAVFAISALHLSRPHAHDSSWVIELVGHQASLPLALAILYHDFRFAFADIFLKRALSLLTVTAAACGFYWFVAGYLFAGDAVDVAGDTKFIAANVGFWVGTAILFPSINRYSDWFVNRVVLGRISYDQLQSSIMKVIDGSESVNEILDNACVELKSTLTVGSATWTQTTDRSGAVRGQLVELHANDASILIPTDDMPNFRIELAGFVGGRRLLSEEISMLEDVALMTARRLDGLRVTHERCEQEIREQEFSKLASEAELRALRAQINPHFLFNALTTVSYLIQTSPEKANETLMQLTKLLRGVLRSTDEFMTLGEELSLVGSYLEIERARFEERLDVEIDVPESLKDIRIPSLVLQPLVENAVKHGISPKTDGGRIAITGRESRGRLVLSVTDTGDGLQADEVGQRRKHRIGLNNVEDRLRLYFNDRAKLEIRSRIGSGTIVEITIDLEQVATTLPQNRVGAPATNSV